MWVFVPLFSDSGIKRVDTRVARPEPQVRGAPVGTVRYLLALRTSVPVRHPLQRTDLQEQAQDGLLSHHHGQPVSLVAYSVNDTFLSSSILVYVLPQIKKEPHAILT